MKPIFWILLAGVVIWFCIGIVGNIKDEKKTKGKERPFAEKYNARGVLGKYETGKLNYELVRLGKAALAAGEPEQAREYLEDSLALGYSIDASLKLVECCAAAGDRERAAELLKKEMRGSLPDAYYLAILLRLTDRPVAALMQARSKNFTPLNKELPRAAHAQLARDVLESYDATVREARELAEAGDPAGAADFYKALFHITSDAVGKEDRPQHQGTLIELAIQTAICCCEAGKYDDAKIYAGWENDAYKHPLCRCVLMLAKTYGGTRRIYDDDYGYLELDKAIPVAEKAVRDGVYGAERVWKMLKEASKEALAREAGAASDYLAELAFEEAHGMSREEYEQRKKEAAEEQARAKREQALREKIELAERDADLLSGGTGHSMEEKLLRGEISNSSHEFYSEAKEKYIKKKSQ